MCRLLFQTARRKSSLHILYINKLLNYWALIAEMASRSSSCNSIFTA